MVSSDNHAATNEQSTFAVNLLPGEGVPPAELAGGLGSLSEAFEHAAECLDREDASRAGTVKLAIVEDRGGTVSTVWSYPPEHMPASENGGLIEVFGFDPVHWEPRALGGRAQESSDRLLSAGPPRPMAFLLESHADGDKPEPTIAVAVAPYRESVGTLSRPNTRRVLRMAWADRVLRVFVVMSAASLWLAVTLTELRFFVVFLLALCAGTWWYRLRARAAVGSQTDIDDWL